MGSSQPSDKSTGNPPPHVVVVGAGFGGVAVTHALQRHRVRITLIDRTNHHLFQPLLYQVATAGLNPAEIASPVRSMFGRYRNVTCLMGTVTAVDLAAHVVSVDDGALKVPYDYLVLAVGGLTSYFGHDEWERWAPGLKSLEDARVVRERVLMALERAEKEPDPAVRRRLMTIVVVGGGPTGVELAGAFAELMRFTLARDFRNIRPDNVRILLVEATDRILIGFPEDLAEAARRHLQSLGVTVMLERPVTDVGDGTIDIGGEHMKAETVVWAAGVRAHPLAAALGVPTDRAGRITVDSDLRVPGHDNVYAIGDMVAFVHDPRTPGAPLPAVSPVAIQQGNQVARNLMRQVRGEPLQPFRYRDLGSMATIGRSAAIAVIGNLHFSGFLAWIVWLFVHLMKMVDFENRVVVFMRWGWAYLNWKMGARLITATFPVEAASRSAEAVAPSTDVARQPVSSPSEGHRRGPG